MALAATLFAAAAALAADTRHGIGVVGVGTGAGGLIAGIGVGHGGGVVGGVGVVGGHGDLAGGSKSCRYWCKTPQNQAYCCEDGHDPVSQPFGEAQNVALLFLFTEKMQGRLECFHL